MVQFVIENIQKSISSETIRNYIIKSGFNIVIGNPKEEDRPNVNDLDIENYFRDHSEETDGTQASSVFNMV